MREMARRRKAPAHENHERWLVSYADFITLLFAFFVVLFASGQTDKAKAQQVSDAVSSALANGHFSSKLAAVLGGTVGDKGGGNLQREGPGGAQRPAASEAPPDSHMVELLPSLERLTQELDTEIKEGKLQVDLQARGLVISLREAAFFASGDARILPKSIATLGKVTGVIQKLPNPIRLEGHTDSVPIHNARFQNNWELSAARSIAMLQLFEQQLDIPASRMAVAGYADTVPVAENDTAEGRTRNRRVDIVILNMRSASTEPVKTAPVTPTSETQSRKATTGP
jgi:chemotaxis protein MotB